MRYLLFFAVVLGVALAVHGNRPDINMPEILVQEEILENFAVNSSNVYEAGSEMAHDGYTVLDQLKDHQNFLQFKSQILMMDDTNETISSYFIKLRGAFEIVGMEKLYNTLIGQLLNVFQKYGKDLKTWSGITQDLIIVLRNIQSETELDGFMNDCHSLSQLNYIATSIMKDMFVPEACDSLRQNLKDGDNETNHKLHELFYNNAVNERTVESLLNSIQLGNYPMALVFNKVDMIAKTIGKNELNYVVGNPVESFEMVLDIIGSSYDFLYKEIYNTIPPMVNMLKIIKKFQKF